MKIILKIAVRYLVGKKSRNIINLITLISISSIMVISAALIIILSAFNGLESTVKNVYRAVDPELKITLKEGKNFTDSVNLLTQIREIPEIDKVVPVIEESVLLSYNGKQQIGMIKGITTDYFDMIKIDTMIITGKPRLNIGSQPTAIIGEGMAYILEVNTDDITKRLQVYFPKRGKIDLFNPFTSDQLLVSGIFEIDHDYTNTAVFTSLDFARNILKLPDNSYSGIEIKMKDGVDPNSIKSDLKKILGDGFKIENRFEQHTVMYRVMRGEKLMVFLIITFILVIASFNLVGVISLMLVEKRKDLMLLHSLGMTVSKLKGIFIYQGILIAVIGSFIGLFIGFLVSMSQKLFGFIKLGGGELSKPYPIEFNLMDFGLILAIVITIAFVTSSVRMMIVKFDQRSLSGVLK
jgi:lipoprotein-releasing system permease protein